MGERRTELLEREKTHDDERKSVDLSDRSHIDTLRWKTTCGAAGFVMMMCMRIIDLIHTLMNCDYFTLKPKLTEMVFFLLCNVTLRYHKLSSNST